MSSQIQMTEVSDIFKLDMVFLVVAGCRKEASFSLQKLGPKS